MKRKTIQILLGTALLCNVAFSAASESKTIEVDVVKPQINMYSDITFSQPMSLRNKTFNLKMDILKPKTKEKLPLVLFITGGGFTQSPKERYLQQRLAIAEAGYVVASIEYRTVPDGVFSEALADVKSAVRYLKANSEKYGIEKNKIAVFGDSAGGYLAALAATTNGVTEFDIGENLQENSLVQAAIDIYGLSDLTKVGDDYSKEVKKAHASAGSPEALFVNGIPVFNKNASSINDNLESAQKANPMTYISDKTPPFLIMHGDKDMLVSPSQTDILHKELIKKGIDSERYIVKNADHSDVYWYQPQITSIIISFLNKNLK